MTSADVHKYKALTIDPQECIRCSELRNNICPVFAEVEIDKQQVHTQWPERAVPAAILQGAQGFDTLHTFNPTLDGLATTKAPTCNLPCSDPNPRVVNDDGAVASEHDHCDHGFGTATEHADASASPLDLPVEFLIGIQEEDSHNPVDLMIVLLGRRFFC